MTTYLQAVLLASLISTEDPNADAWDMVDYSRAMARDHMLDCALTDTEGRIVVDGLPDFADALAYDDAPATLRSA
jgi:hypothetical protein